jgi:nucleotide-binding universal stress UspA family protein
MHAPVSMPFRRVLVPIDFDEVSDHALAVAADLAEANKAELTILHVVDLPPYAYANFGASLPPPDVLGALETHARESLEQRVRRVRAKGIASHALLASGVPWRKILGAMDDVNPDLVVIGTRRRAPLQHALLGSVAERVLRVSPVPVLTVPPAAV